MRKFAMIIVLGIAAIGFQSCEKYLDYEGSDAKPRLVINGIFSPDSIFTIELSQSAGYVTSGSLKTLKNGKVNVFSEQGILIDSLIHQEEGIYKGTATAVAGEAYTISAVANGFANAYATDAIPQPVALAAWDTTTITSNFQNSSIGEKKLRFDFTINDPAENNYYILECYGTQTYYIDRIYDPANDSYINDTIYLNTPVQFPFVMETSDAILTSDAEMSFDDNSYYTRSLVFTDELFNGKSQTFRIMIPFIDYLGLSEINVVLKSCSESFFRYKRSLENFMNTDGDPFSQPVQVYNNIEGGFGIWAGYSIDKTKIK